MEDMARIDGAPLDAGQKLATAFCDTLRNYDPMIRLCAVTCVMMTWVINEANRQGISTDTVVDDFTAGLKQSLYALETEGTA